MEIAKDIYQIEGLRGANAFLVKGEELILIDTGMPGSEEKILGFIEKIGGSPTKLTQILLTHYHWDHIGSAAGFKRKTQAKILAHPEDKPYIDGESPQPQPSLLNPLGLLIRVITSFYKTEPVEVNGLLADGQEIGGPPVRLKVIHTPGHTPGSICFYLPEAKTLFLGDAVNRRLNRLSLPPKLFTTNPVQARESLKKLLLLDFEILCFGHGDPITRDAAGKLKSLLG
ncbi:MAG: MBL fold metallo-hydrolase [Deltaproteobacteria bacterium]|nr:MAG: MBL fold metallo-hydrolase [Deltaproteobacteria bacterium]